MHSRQAIAVAAFALLALRAGASEPQPLRYGQAFSAVRSIYSLPVVVADRQGFFRREGLAFTNILIPGGGEKMVTALEDGTVDLAHVATPFLIAQAMKGSDAVAIAAEFDNPIYSLVARSAIRNFAALKGRVLGMADAEGTIAYSIWALLKQHGLGRADVRTREVDGTPQRLGCLKDGSCDAVPLGQPEDVVAVGQGYRNLGVTTDAVPSFLYTVTAARRAWAQAHADRVTAYVRALAGAFRFIRDPAQRGRVVADIVATEAVPAAAARATLDLYLDPDRHVLPRAGEIDLDGVRQVIAFMAADGALRPPLPPPERFVDRRYLAAAGIGEGKP